MTGSAPRLEPPSDDVPAGAPVSVVMPVLNEERHLAEAVRAVLDQRYDGEVEVVLALGPSRDRTDELAHALAAADPRVRWVRNPSGRTPQALNAAIAAARHDVVVRVDGHGVLDPDYLARAVGLLRRTGAANVGGVMAAEGTTAFERAVAAAMTSRFGVGSAAFHTGGEEGPAETVYLGVFRRRWLDAVGGYDPRFARAQDWEMNHRIRQLGGLVWFSPELHVTYRPRASVRALARQYRDYGRWRRVVARTHRGTINLRYLAPPAALAGSLLGLLVAPLWSWALVLPGGYLVVVAVGTAVAGRGLPAPAWVRLPAVLLTMHLCWGWGFITSPTSLVPRGADPVGE